jgi:hypothetical protein
MRETHLRHPFEGRASATVAFAAIVLVSSATTCSTIATIAVAPAPGASLDSTARIAFALVERVTARRGLKPHDPGEAAVRASRELTCFANRSLLVCGEVNAPDIQVSISQVRRIGFTPGADSVRTELLDSLRVEFGASQVRECKWEKWQTRLSCPPLAQPPG